VQNFDAFILVFKDHFSNPDTLNTSLHQVKTLKQNGPAAAYIAHFCEIIAPLDLSESSLCDYFYEGLKSKIKDAIVYAGCPNALDSLDKLTIQLDN